MRPTTEPGHHQTIAPASSLMPTTQARLRNSCDACNTAKVKCSKERPCCRRCQRKEQFCVYSVSLRCSKRPVDGHKTSTQKRSSPSTASTQPVSGLPAHGLSLSTGLEGVLDASLDSASTIPSSLYDFDSLSALSDVNFDLHNLDDYFSSDTYLPPTNFHAYANTAASTPPAQSTFLGQKEPRYSDCIPPSVSRPTVPLCGCQQHILSKLSELSLSATNSNAPVPFDRALSENRAIVALCTSTLDCSTCARSDDITLILTLSALLAHVLQVFESLFRHRREALSSRSGTGDTGGPSPPESVTSRDTPSSFALTFPSLDLLTPPGSVHGSRAGTTAASGLSTPAAFGSPLAAGGPTHTVRLSLGTYELDERDEFILQTSLLKIELSKITALVEAFEARLCATKLHHDLVAYLRGSLGANYEALKRLSSVGRAAGLEGL
ncbi:hypothetical protein BU23DRAFT_551686 [Bimuria novae-zelandiae CBS 107.79]|uniref:Zn(2)-C6 fungal-type domain-containing protein n=1 Tax=Bimuria novae-zelandiae CBS 107.79 TaxID=1447943 RepID=A0A6A5VSJ4_9PLEO|nr:hypothetical protein BU23DRAFT_551686 [Bimuria novae-zelandiae CBS 107.79]